MIPVTLEQVRSLAPHAHLVYLNGFTKADETLSAYGVNENALRLAHFAAQLLHESGGFRIFEEDLSYRTPDRIQQVFGKKRFPTLDSAQPFVRNPIALARKVYNGRMGNTLTNDDGWLFRGRGPMQLTGRENYKKFGTMLGVDLVANPGLVNDPRYLLAIPAVYWRDRGCNALADKDDLTGVTKRINGGAVGLDDRALWLTKTKAVFR